MVQVLEKKELYIVLPVIEEEAKKVEKVQKRAKRKVKLSKHAKLHEDKIDINKIKSYADARVYRAGIYPQ